MNPTTLEIENGYPERAYLPEDLTSWEKSIPDNVYYNSAPVSISPPEYGSIVDKFKRAEIDVTVSDIKDFARMSNDDVRTVYGKDIGDNLADIRCPLGRTGINGVGIFYEAGPSQTSNLVVVQYESAEEVWVPLVFNRGRWNTPGGFKDANDSDGQETAIREFEEEVGIDPIIHTKGVVRVIKELKDSPRTVDNGWIQDEVYAATSETQFELTPSDDAELAEWKRVSTLQSYVSEGLLSSSKYRYIIEAVNSQRN